MDISAHERRELANAHGLSEQYLYQCLSGRRDMSPAEARKLETASDGRLRRQWLCQSSWRAIWPELISAEGAPAVPEPVSPEAAKAEG